MQSRGIGSARRRSLLKNTPTPAHQRAHPNQGRAHHDTDTSTTRHLISQYGFSPERPAAVHGAGVSIDLVFGPLCALKVPSFSSAWRPPAVTLPVLVHYHHSRRQGVPGGGETGSRRLARFAPLGCHLDPPPARASKPTAARSFPDPTPSPDEPQLTHSTAMAGPPSSSTQGPGPVPTHPPTPLGSLTPAWRPQELCRRHLGWQLPLHLPALRPQQPLLSLSRTKRSSSSSRRCRSRSEAPLPVRFRAWSGARTALPSPAESWTGSWSSSPRRKACPLRRLPATRQRCFSQAKA